MSEEFNREALRFEDYESQARGIARAIYGRARRYGRHDISFDDIYSDVCMTWVSCRDNFKPDMGAAFKTYFQSSAFLNLPMFMRRGFNKNRPKHVSFDQEIPGTDVSVGETLADDRIDIEGLVSRRERLRRLAGRFPMLLTLTGYDASVLAGAVRPDVSALVKAATSAGWTSAIETHSVS